MVRTELVDDIQDRLGPIKRVSRDEYAYYTKEELSNIVAAIEESIIDAVSRGEDVSWYGFLMIKRSRRKGHTALDFHSGKPIEIKAHECLKVRPGIRLTNCVK